MSRGKRWIACLVLLATLLLLIVGFRDSRTTALDRLAAGDYSVLDDAETMRNLETFFAQTDDKIEWIYRDMNGDGKEDLVLQEKDGVINGLKPIVGIFTEGEDELVGCVHWDVVDVTTFYSLGAEGLVYFFQYSGTYEYEAYYFYKCDGTWNKELIGGQDAFLIDDVAELPIDYWEETHPDMTEPGKYFRSFTVENVDGKMVENYRFVDEEEWKRSLADALQVAYCEEVEQQTGTMENKFFFPMFSDTTYIDVACELNFEGAFEGTAKLKVSRISDTKIDGYYEMILTDLQGECSVCGDVDEKCEYAKDFPVGYIYVSDEEIYLMDYTEKYLDIFKETECFPPSDAYIEEFRESLMAGGEHYGYFGYRLVCASEGREDTCGVEERIGYAESVPLDYHNYVAVDGDERQYVFGPNEERAEWGTNEYMGITWKENQGMVYYVNGVGAQRDHVSFWVETENDEKKDAEDDNTAEALPTETVWPYYVEEKV